jgi:hypothetical protein
VHFVTVFLPGKSGRGPELTQNGPNAPVRPGHLVPYTQVIARYSQAAHLELDRAALPPSLESYVRRYFIDVSH